MDTTTSSRIILAADELSIDKLAMLASQIGDRLHAVKVHNHYDSSPDIIRMLKYWGVRRVWVDAKLHDVPNTVRLRAKAIRDSGADIISVHASGGIPMMQAALESGAAVYGITVLTSLTEDAAQATYGRSVIGSVCYFAEQVALAGLHGVICSPQEVGVLAQRKTLELLDLVTPGVRSPGKEANDQARLETPANAVRAGATFLVVGRQITKAPDPAAELTKIEAEIAAVER